MTATGARRDFTPKTGSVADRAIAYLQSQPAHGTELSTAALAEAIGAPSANITPGLQPALERGAVFARKKGGHVRSPLFWSLVDHSAPQPRAQVQACRPEDRAMLATPAGTELLGCVVKAMNGSQAPDGAAAPRRTKAGSDASQKSPALAPPPIRIALWSDGTLQIERPGAGGGAVTLVLFSADETRALVRYLEHTLIVHDTEETPS